MEQKGIWKLHKQGAEERNSRGVEHSHTRICSARNLAGKACAHALNQNIASDMPKTPAVLVQLNDQSVRSHAGQKDGAKASPQSLFSSSGFITHAAVGYVLSVSVLLPHRLR
jgi:hypothetical protein